MAYCIRAPGYTSPASTTSAPPTSTSSSGPPGPTHNGQPVNCNRWHVVEEGDNCATVPAKYKIDQEQFFKWNPAVSTDCLQNFWLGSAYCVGLAAGSSTNPPASTTSDLPPAPSPTQEGNAVADCNSFAQAQEGDWCAAFADRHGISTQQLYTWNKLLGENGENCGANFWGTYWYCIGVIVESRRQPIPAN